MKISAPAATVKVPIVIVAVFGSLAAASAKPVDAPDELPDELVAATPPLAPPPEVAAAPPPLLLVLAVAPLDAPPLSLPALSPLEDAPPEPAPEDSALPPPVVDDPELFEPEALHATEKTQTTRVATRQIFIGGSPCPECQERGDIDTENPSSQAIQDERSDGYFTGM